MLAKIGGFLFWAGFICVAIYWGKNYAKIGDIVVVCGIVAYIWVQSVLEARDKRIHALEMRVSDLESRNRYQDDKPYL